MFGAVYSWWVKLWDWVFSIQIRKTYAWFRDEYSQELVKAKRCGLSTRVERLGRTPYWYLCVIVPDEDEIGAVRLVDSSCSHYAVIHRSTKADGWQLSYFHGMYHVQGETYASLQEALDTARDSGLVLQSVMTTAGELRG